MSERPTDPIEAIRWDRDRIREAIYAERAATVATRIRVDAALGAITSELAKPRGLMLDQERPMAADLQAEVARLRALMANACACLAQGNINHAIDVLDGRCLACEEAPAPAAPATREADGMTHAEIIAAYRSRLVETLIRAKAMYPARVATEIIDLSSRVAAALAAAGRA